MVGFRQIKSPGVWMCLVLVGLPGIAEEEAPSREPTIVARSPFIPPGFSPAGETQRAVAQQGTPGNYEFRGVYQLENKYRFLVRDRRSNNGNWVELGQAHEGYEVRSFNPETSTLILFFNNSENELKLRDLEANPTPMPVSQAATTAARKVEPTPRPTRRVIRPASRTAAVTPPERDTGGTPPPPPAWLQKLREESETRRAEAMKENPDLSLETEGPPPPPGG
ncbi:MAG: hypothetical protein ACP5I4_09010 [Oceanipulchritudo sp.]